MLNFDLRARLTLDPARSQIARGGFASVENCTWADLSDTIFDFGAGDYAPADLRAMDNTLEGLGAYGGGESWQRNLRLLASISPDLSSITTIEYPDDVAGSIRSFAAQGYPVHWAGWCTPNAQWTSANYNGGISHAGRAVYGDDGGLAFWNVWTGYLVYQADAFWRASYDGGGLLVFHRSLIPQEDDMTPEQDATLHAIANKVLADPGYRFGPDPSDTASPYYPGTANAWGWKYSDWYIDQHPEKNLPRGLQHGAVPQTGAYTTQWGFVSEITDAHGAADLGPILAAIADLKAHPAVASDPSLLTAIEKVDGEVQAVAGHFTGK